MSENQMLWLAALAYLTTAAWIWYSRLSHRFPVLAVHLLTEGVCRTVDVALAGMAARDPVWCLLQVPRLFLWGAITYEVWIWNTEDLDLYERECLRWIALLSYLAAGSASAFVMVTFSGHHPESWGAVHVVALMRQFLMLGFLTWLVSIDMYLFGSRTETDHNVTLCRNFVTASTAMNFFASTFVDGGLGYRFLPWVKETTWLSVHLWQCGCLLAFLAIFSVLVKPEFQKE